MAGRPRKNIVDTSGMVEGIDFKTYTQIGNNGKEYKSVYLKRNGKRGPKANLAPEKKDLIKTIKKMDDVRFKRLLSMIDIINT